MNPSAASLAVTVVGGPTALLEWAGLRLLLDPTFDSPQRYGPDPDDLEKTAGPAVAFSDLSRIDAALVSHHHHEDSLDLAGRDLALTLPLVVTTPVGAADLEARGGVARVIGLADDESIALDDPAVVGAAVAEVAPAGARLHALPAQHGPDEWAERLGPVCGFLLTAPGHPTVYVSGDNSEVAVVEAIAARYGPVDAAVLFAGAARVRRARVTRGRPAARRDADGRAHRTRPLARAPHPAPLALRAADTPTAVASHYSRHVSRPLTCDASERVRGAEFRAREAHRRAAARQRPA